VAPQWTEGAVKALIVDDERLARKELRRLLAEHPRIQVVGEAANAAEARSAMLDLEPELVFLDVQMPGESGFDLLESLDAVPLVVFTTAYDEYALQAFEVSALDYLVKPIEPRRLARTVERLLATHGATGGARQEMDVRSGAPPLSEHHRVFVSDGKRSWLVQLGDVRLFESVGNYTRVFFGKEKPLIHRSLNDLVAKLDDQVFFRANRQQIINLKAVRAIHPWFGGRMMAELEGGHEVTLSRRRAREFRDRMSM
jgi:two-component system LytT family response regulator